MLIQITAGYDLNEHNVHTNSVLIYFINIVKYYLNMNKHILEIYWSHRKFPPEFYPRK